MILNSTSTVAVACFLGCCFAEYPKLFTATTNENPMENSSGGFKIHAWNHAARVSSIEPAINKTLFGFDVDFGGSLGDPKNCSDDEMITEKKCDDRGNCDEYEHRPIACVEWSKKDEFATTRLHIRQKIKKNGSSNHSLYAIRISQGARHNSLSACFSIRGEMLYGGPVGNAYPSQNFVKTEAPFVTGEGSNADVFKWTGAVAEKKWITSGGRAINVKPGSPLFISQNATDLCLILKNQPPYRKDANMHLEYDLCLTNNVKEAWLCQNSPIIKTPFPRKAEYIIREPIWSTWVAYKTNISQKTVMEFASTVKKYGMRMGVLEVDDKWETCYGSQQVDHKTFPNMKKMVDDLHSLGAKVTFWIHPFVNTDCNSFHQLEEHLFKFPNGSIGTTTWWNGNGGLINFVQKNTSDFFANRLKRFQKQYGADGFKFDAGEAYYIPNLFANTPLTDPDVYTTSYVKMAASFGVATEVRVGANSAPFKLFQRLQDTNSDWTLENYGLKSVITSTLQLSILGYRAIMPDMIGGNCYGPPPDKELFIRWIQVSTFLPVMQFSYHPWNFDEETINITMRYIDLHYQYSQRMLDIFNSPDVPQLINPVWWVDPEMPEALRTMDQFLVGDEILVAPVVEKGASNRSVYIPSGSWVDANDGQIITGPLTIPQYPAPLATLPYFLKHNGQRIRDNTH